MKNIKIFTNKQKSRVLLQTDEGDAIIIKDWKESIIDTAFRVAFEYIKGTEKFEFKPEIESTFDKLVLSISYKG